MNETKIHWGQLGIIIIGLLSLSLVTILILKKGDETTNILLSAFSVTTPSDRNTAYADPHTFVYRNEEYNFALKLPKAWNDYRIFYLDAREQGEAIISVSLPVEKYQDVLVRPDDLGDKGVFAVGVRVVMRDSVQKEKERCSQYKSSIEQYQQTMAEGKSFVAANGQEQNTMDACLSLYDPESQNQAIRSQYLGMNDVAYFFRVPLEAFDNGFTEVPGGLKQEIEGVYLSFRSE